MSVEHCAYVGCAGWGLNQSNRDAFPSQGSQLERYSACLPAVEINSSFYRPHRPQTYARWAGSVPAGFRFSVKVPKTITHTHRLVACEHLLDAFLEECLNLGERLGCLLIQLPPSLSYEPTVVATFLDTLRLRYAGGVVIEPRHRSWAEALPMLADFHIAQVAADPPRIETDLTPNGWPGLRYWRLHGSPKIYYSDYGLDYLRRLAIQVNESVSAGVPTWCIFDNTAAGAAVGNALALQSLLS